MSGLTVVILAAGLGTRLGRSIPKALTELADGHTILDRQVTAIRLAWPEAKLIIVVGFKQDLVMEACPDALFVYNDCYDRTNTVRSLQRALEIGPDGPVVWMNGDVVLDVRVLRRLGEAVAAGRTAVCVEPMTVGEEEVKYTLDPAGLINELSKTATDAVGEAVGINTVSTTDRPLLLRHLQRCADNDYFERGLETAIADDGLAVHPVDVGDLLAVEVDFEEDLAEANRRITS